METPDSLATTTLRRKLSAVIFGYVYGGSLLGSVERGLDYTLGGGAGLNPWPVAKALGGVLSIGLAAFLAAYVSRALAPGVVAAVLSLPVFLFFSGSDDLRIFAALVGVALGCGLAAYAPRLPASTEDIAKGRLFGVRWPHYLWLWFPWQVLLMNAVWLSVPSTLLKPGPHSGWDIFQDVGKIPVVLVMLGCTWGLALQSIGQDAPWSRAQSVLRFLGWTLLAPLFLNFFKAVFM